MLTWLTIGILAQVAWMIVAFEILKLVTFRGILRIGVIGWLVGISLIVVNVLIWPVAVIFHLVFLYEIFKV